MPFHHDNTVVYNWGDDWDEDMPTNAAEFMQWLQSKIDLVPAEVRHAAKIEIDAEASYEDSALLRLIVYYPKNVD